MSNNGYGGIALIGGAAGALDAIDGAALADKDTAIVFVQDDKVYHYVLDADSAAAESSPDIIAPDANGGDKRWILHYSHDSVQIISANTTYYIATGGNDAADGSSGTPWATIQHALDYLADYWWDTSNVTITITCADGTYTPQAAITPSHPCWAGIVITGTNTHAKSMTSVQSSSGSAGAWAIIVNLDSVADIAVNDYVIISGSANGTKPDFIEGCHKVTNVDSGNTRITFTSTHKHATAPSGAITATVKVIKCMMSFSNGTNGFTVTDGHGLGVVKDMVLVGDGSTASTYGVYCAKGSIANISNDAYGLGVVNWKAAGVYCYDEVMCYAPYLVVSSSLDDGVSVFLSSSLDMGNGIISGCGDIGAFIYYSAFFNIASGTVTGNGDDNIQAYVSSCASCSNMTNTGSTDKGYYANLNSFIMANGDTVRDNGTDYSPAGDTEGNVMSYIQTS